MTSEEFAAFIKAHTITECYIARADATVCVKSTCYSITKTGYTNCVTGYNKKKRPEMMAYYANKGCAVAPLDEVMQK